MRISDWSSDVCSSDLLGRNHRVTALDPDARAPADRNVADVGNVERLDRSRRVDALGSRRRSPLARCLYHEVAPDARGPAAACTAPKPRVVVVSDPHPDDEVATIADEQPLAQVIGGSRLDRMKVVGGKRVAFRLDSGGP